MKAPTRRPRRPALATQLLRDERGIVSIEFAILAFVAVILMTGTIELALEMIADSTVQLAAQEASRVGLTTTAPSSGSRPDQAAAIVNKILGGWTQIGATLTISELNYGTYGNLTSTTFTPSKDMGGFGDVIAYNIQLTMPGITGIPKMFGVDELTFERNYIVQNEK